MFKERIPETNNGITGELLVKDYDLMQKTFRDRGTLATEDIFYFGINTGNVLEIGPGPGYLGLEWLKKSNNGFLYWLEISEDMKNIAIKNAKEYGLEDRVKCLISDATKGFPFKNDFFDAVITSGSFHEWQKPIETINEINRVLKKEGKFFIEDLKRDINPFIKFLMKSFTKQKAMKNGLISSINAAYLKSEINIIFNNSKLENFNVKESPFGLTITGEKK